MFEKFLQEIGLSEKEAQVYLALTTVDNAAIQDIAKKTGINRTTVYPVLQTLSTKGLVSEVQVGKKVHYEAAGPERLETFVERQRVVFEERSARLKEIIPQIKSIQREAGERPIVKYYEGRDGAISAYEEFYTFDPNIEEEGYFIFNRNLSLETFSKEEHEAFLKKRVGKNLKPISVYNYKEGEFPFKTPGTRTRIDEKKYPIQCDISVAQDRVVIITLGEKISAFLIKSQDIANTFKSLVRKINEV